jgi:prepilin-type N-terminal cleavage/methylation domain-containing protein/prepilin-type processing-associated H-X9-DG protein
MRPAPTKDRGFTLIELLVVIAIIAIVAAILFPVFAQVREKARQVHCLSALGQINRALLIYAQDYDETLPRIRFRIVSGYCESTSQVFSWRGAIQPYVKSYDFWRCPSNPNKDFPTEDVDKNTRISYAINPMTLHGWGQDDKTPSRTLASFAEPATTMQLLESEAACPDLGDWVGNGQVIWDTPPWKGMGMCGADGQGLPRLKFHVHNGILNWGFVDGHVRAMKYAALWQPGLTPPYHDMWDTWEDDTSGKPDRGQLTGGIRARDNVTHICPYLR